MDLLRKYKISFFFAFLGLAVLTLPYFVLAQSPGGLVPCSGIFDCNACALVQLADNVIDFLIIIAVSIAAICFAIAGFYYITSQGNPGNVTKAHDIFWNVFIGLIIALVAWLVVDTIMKTFISNSSFGPWNQVTCYDVPLPSNPIVPILPGGPVVAWGFEWQCEGAGGGAACTCSAASPSNGSGVIDPTCKIVQSNGQSILCSLGALGEQRSTQCSFPGGAPPVPGTGSGRIWQCQTPGGTQCACSTTRPAGSFPCTDTGTSCPVQGGLQQCGAPTGGLPDGVFTYQGGIQAQTIHASSQLNTLLACMASRVPANVGEISSISDGAIIRGDATFQSCIASPQDPDCAHSRTSCHYGGVAQCNGQSYAVDFGDQQNAQYLIPAANQCGANFVLNEGDHIHVSVGAACGCR